MMKKTVLLVSILGVLASGCTVNKVKTDENAALKQEIAQMKQQLAQREAMHATGGAQANAMQEKLAHLEHRLDHAPVVPAAPAGDVDVSVNVVGMPAESKEMERPEVRHMGEAEMIQKEGFKPVRVAAIGYGAESTYEGYTPGQQRLMAIRASKLDAYRSLAEQIYGIRINGNTTVSAMMAKSDGMRARVDAMVRGARIVSITPMADGNYETVVEVFFDPEFYKDVFVFSRESEKRYDQNSWMY
jgi:hypothetical protein